MMFLRFYKIDPYSMFQNMTVTDFQSMMQLLENQNKKDREDKQGDKLMKCLTMVRDILNYMMMPER